MARVPLVQTSSSPGSSQRAGLCAEQLAAAEKSKAAAGQVFRDPITTEIVPLEKFWPAEQYHQDYFRLNPNAGYCAYVIAPKIKKLKQEVGEEKK